MAGSSQPLTDCGVDERVQGVLDQVGRALAAHVCGPGGLGPAHRRHRTHQRLHSNDVRPLQHRPPACGVAVVVLTNAREHSATLGELACEGGQLGEVVQRRAVPHAVGTLVKHSQRGGGVERHPGHRPGEQHRCFGGRRTRRHADQLGRVQRCSTQRRQEQCGRRALSGVDVRDLIGRRGERVRPGGAKCFAAALHRPLGVLGPQEQAMPWRPEPSDLCLLARPAAIRRSRCRIR
jgi:hypothetical protein